MRKPNRREVILGSVLVAAVGYTMSLDAAVKRKKQHNTLLRGNVAAQDAGMPIDNATLTSHQAPKKEAGMAAESWGFDPFERFFAEPAPGEGGAATDGEEPQEAFRLQGIMHTSRGATAMINGEGYVEGSSFSGYVIDRIGRHSIVIRNTFNGSTVTLEVK